MVMIKKIIIIVTRDHFCHICKLSLSKDLFPQNVKIANVIPIFKSGDKSAIGNCRPVSLLTQFSILLEKTTHAVKINVAICMIAFGARPRQFQTGTCRPVNK